MTPRYACPRDGTALRCVRCEAQQLDPSAIIDLFELLDREALLTRPRPDPSAWTFEMGCTSCGKPLTCRACQAQVWERRMRPEALDELRAIQARL